MREYRLLIALTVLLMLAHHAFASTVYVYSPLSLQNTQTASIPGIAKIASTHSAIYGNYVFVATVNGNAAYLYRYDMRNGQVASTAFAQDVTVIDSIDASCGTVTISYQTSDMHHYIVELSANLQPIRTLECLPVQNIPSTSGEGYIACGPKGQVSQGTTDMYITDLTVKKLGCGPNSMYAVAASVVSNISSTTYLGLGYALVVADNKAFPVSVHAAQQIDPSKQLVEAMFIGTPTAPGNKQWYLYDPGYVGIYMIDTTSGTVEQGYVAKFTTDQVNDTYTLQDGTTWASLHFNLAKFHEIDSAVGPHIAASSVYFDPETKHAYAFIDGSAYTSGDTNYYFADITDPDNPVKLVPFSGVIGEYNMVASGVDGQTLTAAQEITMCKNNNTYVFAYLASEGDDYYEYIGKYIPKDSKFHILYKIDMGSTSDGARPAKIFCTGDDTYYLVALPKVFHGDGTVKVYTLKDFFVTINPPYFQSAPGSDAQFQIQSTIPATLTGTDAPQGITVNAPQTIGTEPSVVTVSIDPSFPEGNYGVIKLKYQSSDAKTFTSGIIFRSLQVNDPPTTPEIKSIDLNNGNVTITWYPSVDPDGDTVTYEYNLQDNTQYTTVASGSTSSTSITAPVTPGDTYTFTLVATDGNLFSDTVTKQFTYDIQLDVSIASPTSGTYVVSSVPVVINYTTNVPATLELQASTDGSNWQTVDTNNVSGSGTVTYTYPLQNGDNYLRAQITYGSQTVVSDIVQLYYEPDTNYILSIVQPSDGDVYEAPPNGTVNVSFTGVFDTSEDNGTRAYSIQVFDQNGTEQVVASVSTDEPTYTLQGQYGLPKGEYVAYPVYTNPFGSNVYGQPVKFKVVESNNPNNPPSIPLPIQVEGTTDTNVTLTWHQSTDPEGNPITYHVQLSDSPDFNNLVVDTTTKNTYLDVNALFGGKMYYWKVQACDDQGACSAWSPVSAFPIYESTAAEIISPQDGGSYVTSDDNTYHATVRVAFMTNAKKDFNINILADSTSIYSSVVTGPKDTEIDQNYAFPAGQHTITVQYTDLDTNETYAVTSTFNVYLQGEANAPKIQLIDPEDGYFEEIPAQQEYTTLTARAHFELPVQGDNNIAIEYKLRWAATWNTVTSETVNVTQDNNSFDLTGNVQLAEGVYLFRAKVVDPTGKVWYSDPNTATIRYQINKPQNNTGTTGGGGGGGGGGAPIIVPEKVVWKVGTNETVVRAIHVKNVATNPIRVKIWYEGNVGGFVVAPPEQSAIIIPPGDYNIMFRVSGKGMPVGMTYTGAVVLSPTGTSIEIPVEIDIVSKTGEGTPTTTPTVPVNTSVLVPVVVAGAVVALYLLYAQGVI